MNHSLAIIWLPKHPRENSERNSIERSKKKEGTFNSPAIFKHTLVCFQNEIIYGLAHINAIFFWTTLPLQDGYLIFIQPKNGQFAMFYAY